MSKITRHDSAHKHVAGTSTYSDDIILPENTLHAYAGLSTCANGTITSKDFTAVLDMAGVVDVLHADNLPRNIDLSPTGQNDEPLFAKDKVEFYGQPIFAVIAKTRDIARRAAQLAEITYNEASNAIDVLDAEAQNYPNVTAPLTLQRGDVDSAMQNAPHKLEGEMRIGGQDHFYLEGQIAIAIPGEDDDLTIYTSTQHPSEAQHMVAHALDIPFSSITTKVRRMGGGFGGKESQSNFFAVVTGISAHKHRVPVKMRPDRDDDMISTGKRHDFVARYKIGFDDKGVIQAVDGNFLARCGYTSDLSGPVTDRSLFHADSSYYYENVRLQSHPLKTNTVSNTAFRGFGGPQGMLAGERFIEEIAYALGEDPLTIRKRNFYGTDDRNITPYHQVLCDNISAKIVDELEDSSEYQKRREAIIEFNKQNPILKKGIALTPVKFGISFTATWYNQAGALVHVYKDGSIALNHGGTEMGQGLFTKVAQVVAEEFSVDVECVKITETTTDKVPNTSATAASSGSDLNGMAALDAAQKIKARLINFACEKYQVTSDQVAFENNHILIGNKKIPFGDFTASAYMERVQLSDTGFYKTPEIHWNRETGRGNPFYYFAYGASCSEVIIDSLTGEYKISRVDILHDVGSSLNAELDIGQIEGGFIQGMGWLTTEELWWDDKGRLRTHAPSTYKIPLASDIPDEFNVKLATWSKNVKPTIKRSKAVGEPPFMLANSVLEALSMAVASHKNYKVCPSLNAPATPEEVLMAIERLNKG